MEPAAKQQTVERIKQSENILVTVSTNPSVDQLASTIGLTLLLNKMGKSATAVYSGKTPSTLKFLQPEKTLETSTDSLRDFIISLDKSKADKLRYKVEDQVVRIFITPYRTSLGEKDLTFSEGDFNVDLVIALGVEDRVHLDTTIAAHGRILHDATVISISAKGGKAPDIGQINWQDPAASSLSEMLVSISEAFGTGLIDSQIATAFLTGIVAETDRFSNKKTSPKVMTMSAQLMASGANQQLVVSNLEPPQPAPKPVVAMPPQPKPKPQTPPKSPSVPKPAPKPKAPPASPKPKPTLPPKKGELNVAHNPLESDSPEVEVDPSEIRIDQQGNLKSYQDYKKEEAKHPKQPPAQKPLSLPAIPPPEPLPPPKLAPELPQPPAASGPVPPPPPPPPPITPMPPPAPAAPPLPPVNPIPPSAAAPNVPSASATADDPHHAFIDPAHRPAGVPGGYSPGADGQGWDDSSSSNAPIDPLNNANVANNDPLNGTSSGASEFAGHSKVIAPPPDTHHSLDELLAAENAANAMSANPQTASAAEPAVDTARSAVESAYQAVPFNPDLNPVTALNAQPLSDNLNGSGPGNPAPAQQAPATAPPPMPPPIPPIVPSANNGPQMPPPSL